MAKTGFIVMADITGYTVYLNESELDHAQESIVAILDVIVGSTDAPLTLSRVVGDAVLSYAFDGAILNTQTLVEELERYVGGGSVGADAVGGGNERPALQISLLQPRPSSLIMTSTLDIIPIVSVPAVSDVDRGFDGMDKALMCIEMYGKKSCGKFAGDGGTVITNNLTPDEGGSHFSFDVWMEDGEGRRISNEVRRTGERSDRASGETVEYKQPTQTRGI